jgi:hypothetical protein
MWELFKAFFSGKLRKVFDVLKAWLKTKSAEFVADNWEVGLNIVKSVARQTDLSGSEKAKLAAKLITEQLKEAGKKEIDNFEVNQLIETTLGLLKDQYGKFLAENKTELEKAFKELVFSDSISDADKLKEAYTKLLNNFKKSGNENIDTFILMFTNELIKKQKS